MSTYSNPFKRTICIIGFILCLFSFKTQAQQVNQFNSWWIYSGNLELADNCDIHISYTWSRSDFIKNWQLSKLQLGVNYHYLKQVSFGLGYDWIILFPYGEQPIAQERVEHRPYEQFEIKTIIKSISFKYRTRLEQRLINNSIRNRIRFRMAGKIPLFQQSKYRWPKLYLLLSNEIMLHFGKPAKGHLFDQNRLYAGINISINPSISLSPAYMNQYLVKRDSRIENNHTLVFMLTHKMSFRR